MLNASQDRIEAFGKSLVVLVDRDHPEESLLLKKPTKRIAHTGGERIKPGSPEEAALKAWIEMLASLKGDELAAAMKYQRRWPGGRGGAALREPCCGG